MNKPIEQSSSSNATKAAAPAQNLASGAASSSPAKPDGKAEIKQAVPNSTTQGSAKTEQAAAVSSPSVKPAVGMPAK